MDVAIGLVSLAGLSLFLARFFQKSASLMPLVAVGLCSLWLTLWGCVNLLYVGGLLWYALCAVALGWVLVKERGGILRRITPGYLLFLAGSLFFIVYFAISQPLMTSWDEFTFWGTAAKVVADNNTLYTLADSNLIARSYPPGLIVFTYGMQFFGGAFADYKLMAALCMVYLAAFAAGSALLDKHRAAAVVLLAAMVAMPLLFETGPLAGNMSRAYLTCYADPSLAALFGGALALYFGGGKRDGKLFAMLAVVLAALTNIKDIGLALAMVAVLVMALDMLLVRRQETALGKLKGVKAALCGSGLLVIAVAAAYGVWAAHLALVPDSVNRFNVGAGGESLGMVSMLLGGVLALLGINRTEQFSAVLSAMLRAPFDGERPVSLFGPGIRVFAIIVLVLAAAWLLAGTKAARRRVVVFAVSSSLGFVLFYVFNIFTYAFIFQPVEAVVLKDYDRYIGPYWQGWLVASLVLLAASVVPATEGKVGRVWRRQVGRLTLAATSACLLAVVALQGNGAANVLQVSPSLYGERLSVQAVVRTAEAEGMLPEDVVYPVNQYDNGTRFYMLGYEMQAKRSFLYMGMEEVRGKTVLEGNVASRLVPLGSTSTRSYAVQCNAEIFTQYLAQTGCTGVLLDNIDDTFYEGYRELFADGLAGWNEDGTPAGGARFYRVVWLDEDKTACRLVAGVGGGTV